MNRDLHRVMHQSCGILSALMCMLAVGGLLSAQTAPEKVLVVNGKEIPGAVAQIQGRLYVSVDALPQIVGGQLTVEADRIVVTLPTAIAASVGGAATVAQPISASQGLSREFVREAVATLANMREWKVAVATAMSFGIQFVGNWPNDYRDRVQEGLVRARTAIVTDADRSAFALLQNEFNGVAGWSNDVVSARQSLNAARNIDPNALRNDTVHQKITDCANFLNSMMLGGAFADDRSCH